MNRLCPSHYGLRQKRPKEKRDTKEYRIAHLKEEGRTVKHLSYRNKFLKPLRTLERLGECEAAGRVLLQTLTIFLREMINLNLYLSYYDVYKTAHNSCLVKNCKIKCESVK